jgi:hypothetical protein
MSNGAVAQLVSRGKQDEHITGNPQITFFNSSFKRHSNFSTFTQEQTIEGIPKAGGTSRVVFKRSGDLLGHAYIDVKINGQAQLIDDWRNVIECVELYVGGQKVDCQDSEFSEDIAIDLLATTYSKSFSASLHGGLGSSSFFYPLRFFFCESWQSSLPIVALQYHDVELKIIWAQNLNANYSCHLNASYACLDEHERNKVALSEHNMLIYQVQTNKPSNQMIQELTFNHPVKFIASSNVSGSNNLVSRTNKVKIRINGSDVDDYKVSVPYYTSVPCYYNTEFSAANSEGMFVYPFCLMTSKYQPTGTLNFSRIDSCTVHCTENINRTIYAVNYNILKIKDGMGRVLYVD